VCDGLFVFKVCGPYGYFITFGSDVNDGSTNIVTVVIKRFTHKTQELQGKKKNIRGNLLLNGSSVFLIRCILLKSSHRVKFNKQLALFVELD